MFNLSYYTYFEGKIEFELKEEYLNELKKTISEGLRKKTSIFANENSLEVNDEWKDQGFMENIVLYIQKYGTLLSGKILCHGEDQKDIWEIFILDNKPYVREIGTAIRPNRTRIEEWIDSKQEISKGDKIAIYTEDEGIISAICTGITHKNVVHYKFVDKDGIRGAGFVSRDFVKKVED